MRNNKFLKSLLAGALSITMLAGAIPVSAEETTAPDTEPVAPRTLIVTKNLETTPGTTLPAFTFNFQLQYVSAELPEGTPLTPNGLTVATPAPAGSHGAWAPGAEWRTMGSAATPATSGADLPANNTVTADSQNLLAGITFPNAGEFTFLLREQADTNTLVNDGGIEEDMTYDGTIYEVRVWVHRDAAGDLFVAGVHVWLQGDRDTTSETTLTAGKVDDVEFNNEFVREVDGTYCPEDEYPCEPGDFDTGLRVSKTIAGDAASPTSSFVFTGTLTHASDLIPATRTYNAFIYNADGTRVTTGPGSTGTPIVFSSGSNTTFNLVGGQELRFAALPVGTQFQISEDPGAYTASHVLLVNGGTVTGATGQTASNTGGPHRVGQDGANYAAFTNTRTTAPITGLLADNLPFVLVGIAAVGFIGLLAVSRRRRAYEA